MATFEWYDEWKGKELTCRCGWKGRAGSCPDDVESRDGSTLFCPKCGDVVGFVLFPTPEDTRAAAERGDKEALMNLPFVEIAEKRREVFDETKLASPDQLPRLEGDKLEFIWDITDNVKENLVVCKGEIVWREIAFWESWPRFNEIKAILQEKYGSRFKSLTPSEGSENYLYGDDLAATQKIELT